MPNGEQVSYKAPRFVVTTSQPAAIASIAAIQLNYRGVARSVFILNAPKTDLKVVVTSGLNLLEKLPAKEFFAARKILSTGDSLSIKELAENLIQGVPLIENKTMWKEIVSSDEFSIILNLNMGEAAGEIWSNDLSEEYVNFNKSE